ncbi:phospholipase D zeta 1-like isoform X2 [Olea europaea var. sylvestris]|uniref:phospholipase D zeta 1-like isoform X2 n=1 Tax=Olea europaea var. sylvestris TaxID=158386 RepID=UPI000C1D3DED|nr:phospholipase D zeta 1-like isoform X2 [Olea europaea var. sylvestris]
MSTERLIAGDQLPSSVLSSSHSIRYASELGRIFEELPNATIVSVSRPDASDITPLLLSYTIELEYKQFKWLLLKKASQVIYLHLALKKRALIEEFHEKQEQIKEWLQSVGLGDDTTVVHDEDEPDDGAVPISNEDSARNRNVPSRAALSIIRPAIGKQHTISDKAKVAMQGYLNHFLGNLDIINSREVCRFLEVSKLSFLREYGPKLKEGYVMAKHLTKFSEDDPCSRCFSCHWCNCCNNTWQKVWLILKPGFLAFLEDPFSTKLLDIIVIDILPASNAKGVEEFYLAKVLKGRNPLRHAFQVSCGSRSIKLRTTSADKVHDWVSAINEVLKPSESWCQPHRFNSFAPTRGLVEDESHAQWFIDGKSAFEAIASSIETANSEIYITGWWLCPELYLRRPFHNHNSSRLDVLLEAKAKQGVQIYILLYKEVSLALKINSSYSKRRLLSIHENVRVLRYPDHLSTGVYLWSHHEKLVIVDHKMCFIGGLDLCFGRYDTIEHKVGDFPPFLWPGKDYYNPRESEPNSWEDAMRDEMDREKYPRMPWHDVHCALWGPPCRDIARHFIQRWNHAKKSKAPNEQKIPLLMPHHHMVLPHYMGRSKEVDIDHKNSEVCHKDIGWKDSFSSESPPEDVPLLLPPEANGPETSVMEHKLNFLNSNECHETTLYGHFEGDHDWVNTQSESILEATASELQVKDYWCETLEQGSKYALSNELAQVGPCTSCRCQVVRSVSQWSAGTSQTEDSIQRAYCSLIEEAENFVYIENQFFISGLSEDEVIQNRVLESLYSRIIRAYRERKRFRAIIVIPLLPGFQGGVDDSGAATVRAIMHWQYRTICRGESSILQKLCSMLGPIAHDFISFYGLRTYGRLFDGGPLVTSQVYVHSKVMIVDDRCALVGSCNINDRSLLGSRDSEIAVLIEDTEFVGSSMNEKPWKAGKFSLSLRLSLWGEHLGLNTEELSRIRDPIADSTFKNLWVETAKANTKIYQDVFSCIPNDLIHSRYIFRNLYSHFMSYFPLCFCLIFFNIFINCRSSLRQSVSHWKQKLGHTTIDLGVASSMHESHQNGESVIIDSLTKLKSVKGFLVSFPLEFMSQEQDLRPMFIEGEFYASPQVFH